MISKCQNKEGLFFKKNSSLCTSIYLEIYIFRLLNPWSACKHTSNANTLPVFYKWVILYNPVDIKTKDKTYDKKKKPSLKTLTHLTMAHFIYLIVILKVCVPVYMFHNIHKLEFLNASSNPTVFFFQKGYETCVHSVL